MKKALLLFPVDQPFRHRLESLLYDKGLNPCSIDTGALLEQIQSPAICILLLDGELFVSLDPHIREQLSKTCRQNNIPALLTSCELLGSLAPAGLPWLCGIIRNSADEEEWAEKIDTYRHLSRLEHEVRGLQNKIKSRWRENEEDLRSAAQIQQSLLPKKLPSLPHFNVSCHFHPFEKIGGDLFSITQVDEDTLMVFLLDVSGHGISSAMVSISVHQSLSINTGQIVKRIIDTPPYYRLVSPAEVLSELANEYPFERFEMFFTIVYMLINIHTGETTYCSAGHPPAILQRKTGEIQRLSTGGGLVGLPDTGPFEQGKVTLKQGDRLFLFSDGLIDHTDAADQCFGEERLILNLTRTGDSLQQACLTGIDAMHNFRGKLPPQDDVSLLGLEFTKSTNANRNAAKPLSEHHRNERMPS